VLVVYERVNYGRFVRSWESGSKGGVNWQRQQFQTKIMSHKAKNVNEVWLTIIE